MLNAPDGAKSQDAALKRYQKPTLVKGPMLAQVTADTATVSGLPQNT
jgi:hypothetical protein